MRVFPSKHVLLSETCYGLGGLILKLYENGDDVDSLYEKVNSELKKISQNSDSVVNQYYLTLTYLYTLDIISIDKELNIKV